MEENKDVVVDETPTAAEKEEKVLEAAGQDAGKTEDGMYKVDLSKPVEQEPEPVQEEQKEEVTEEQKEEVTEENQLTLEEVIEEETKEEPEVEIKEEVQDLQNEVEEAVQESQDTGIELPENIQKVVDFMNETGGTLEDYVKLNQDYSNIEDSNLLYEYYNQTKAHLAKDEIDFLIEDNFSYDEEIDEPNDIKRKKLAYKEEIAKAKSYLEGLKGKYYEEVKLGSKLSSDQQKAIEFFNTYNAEQSEQQKTQEKQTAHFNNETNKVFSEEFKGFDFKVGDKKYRFNIKDKQQVKDKHSDILNVFTKYINEDNLLKDAGGYHKALFVADNADEVANHFYEQGKADAIKDSIAKSKNVDMSPRQTFSDDLNANGIKVRVLDDEGPDFKFKIKNK